MADHYGFLLSGADCSALLTSEAITVSGNYYRYDLHRRRRVSGTVTVELLNVLRVGFTRTYSRFMLAVPMVFGFLAMGIKAIPSIGYQKEIVRDVYSVGVTLWSVPFQDKAWKLCAVLCLLTVPLYLLSYRNDLEINTARGRYLLPRKGMEAARIAGFQREFTRLKEERRKAAKKV